MVLSEKLIDKRVLRRSLERGLIDKGEFENHLANLPDLGGQVDRDTEDREASEARPAPYAHGAQP